MGKGIKAVQAAFPDFPLPSEPALRFDQRAGFDVTCADTPFFDGSHDARIFQNLEVAHEGGQRHFVRCMKFADASRARSKSFNDRTSGRVGHSAEE